MVEIWKSHMAEEFERPLEKMHISPLLFPLSAIVT